MIKWIHEGVIYQVNIVTFDLVDQLYCMDVSRFRVIDHWRRESGRIAIELVPMQIFIGNTAHVRKLKDEGYNEAMIERAIYENGYNYLTYALTKRNEDLVWYRQGKPQFSQDRLEHDEALKILEVPSNQIQFVAKFNAY